MSKRNILIAVMVILFFCLSGCGVQTPSAAEEEVGAGSEVFSPDSSVPVNLSNPMEEVDDLEEMQGKLEFEVALPDNMPEGYFPTHYFVINGNVGEIRMTNGDEEVIFRKAKGNEDISGVYETFTVSETVDVIGAPVDLTYDKTKSGVAKWRQEGYSYSVYMTQGSSHKKLVSMVETWMPRE